MMVLPFRLQHGPSRSGLYLLFSPSLFYHYLECAFGAQRPRFLHNPSKPELSEIDAPTLCAFVLDQLHRDASEDPEQAILLLAADWSAKRSALVIAIDDAERLPLATAGRLGALAMAAGGGLRIVAAAPEPATALAHALGCDAEAVALRAPMTLRETQTHLQAALAAAHAPPEVSELFHGLGAAQIFHDSRGIPSEVNAFAAERVAMAVADGAVAEPGRAAWGRALEGKHRPIVSL